MFRPGWKMTFFTLLFAPLLFWLGHWQLDREQEKIKLQQEYETRQSALPVPVDSVDWNRIDLGFLKISADGMYDNEHTLLLDNRVHEGSVGFEVLSPFVTNTGLQLLINRGWIPQGASRSELPEVQQISDQVHLEGTIYVPLEEPFMLGAAEEMKADSGLQIVQSIEMQEFSRVLGANLAPYSVRLLTGSTGLETPNWQAINMLPEKHRAYAVQWFAMLAALIALFIYFGFKNPRLDQTRES